MRGDGETMSNGMAAFFYGGLAIVVGAFAFVACNAKPPCYATGGRIEMANGIAIGDGVQRPLGYELVGDLDATQVDAAITEVTACLRAMAPLSKQEAADAWCQGEWAPEVRSCLTVAAAPDWRVSSCSGAQVFSCDAPKESCLAKGQKPTAACPCSCSAAIQHGSVVVTTPDLSKLRWLLAQLFSGCDQVQNVARLARCGGDL